MQLKRYQAYVHQPADGDQPMHVDVELTVKGRPIIKMCDCSNYMGNVGAFGHPAEIAPVVREDLAAISNSGEDIDVVQDELDGSIDIYRTRDGALLFSMECDHIEGADWVRKYNSEEGYSAD